MKIKKNYFLLTTYYLLLTTYGFPAFQDTGWGTRAGGMGNTFTAIANDPSATLWNPAGIAQLEMLETTFMYNKLFAGIDDVNLSQMYAAGVYPTAIGSFGLTVTDFALWGYYRENTVSASYARDLAEDLGVTFPLMAGLNLKYLTHSYMLDSRTKSMDNPVFAGGTSAGGFTPDIGILLKPSDYSFGFSALNILQPDVGLKTEDNVPMILKFGTAYRGGDWAFFENITPTVDVSYRKPADNTADFKVSGGIESWFNYNTFAARLGGNDREFSFGFSYNKMFSETGLQLDYAFLLPLQMPDTSGSHRLSLTFRYTLSEEKVKAKEKIAQEEGMHSPPAPPPQKEEQPVPVHKEEQPVPVQKEEQPVPVQKEEQPVPVQKEEQPVPVHKEEQPVPVHKELTPEKKLSLKKGHYDAALRHYEKGEYELAIAGWEAVLRIDPNDADSKNKIELAKIHLAEKKQKAVPVGR